MFTIKTNPLRFTGKIFSYIWPTSKPMSDHPALILLNTFLISHTKVIRSTNVLTDVDLSELFEAEVDLIRSLTTDNLSKFKDESVIALTREEKTLFPEIQYVYTDPGVFTLAGLIKTKRSIRIYVQLIELMVSRLQNRAYEIAVNYQNRKA